MKYNPMTIWNCEQNKPSLVVDDLIEYLSHTELGYHMESDSEDLDLRNTFYEILLNRGVFKWLAVRRDLIKLKDKWKRSITASITWQTELKRQARETNNWWSRKKFLKQAEFCKGYRAGLEQARAEVRSLCHSQRWRAPDNDKRAQRWLEGQSG